MNRSNRVQLKQGSDPLVRLKTWNENGTIAPENPSIFCWVLNRTILGLGLASLCSCGAPAANNSSTGSANGGSPTPTITSSIAASKPAIAQRSPTTKAPLTVEKLKNAEYFFLAKGPIKLTNGTYQDPQTQRTFTLDQVVTYGDLNKDGIKDAAGSIKVTIPNSGNFSYLVAVVNQGGAPQNISAEFLGAQVKVKSIAIKADASMEVAIEQYRPGDADCCPSIGLTRTYKLRSNQSTASPVPSPQK